jgi:hypothetical protein
MSNAFKVKFPKGCNNKVPVGYELQVVTISSKPQEKDVRAALVAAGINIGMDTINGYYVIVD